MCADADDQKLLDLALAARAHGIVTGEDHLLRLAWSCPVNILTLAEARIRLGGIDESQGDAGAE